jgi:hypothetical protein
LVSGRWWSVTMTSIASRWRGGPLRRRGFRYPLTISLTPRAAAATLRIACRSRLEPMRHDRGRRRRFDGFDEQHYGAGAIHVVVAVDEDLPPAWRAAGVRRRRISA